VEENSIMTSDRRLRHMCRCNGKLAMRREYEKAWMLHGQLFDIQFWLI
jgi:hypothetical protein